MNKESILRKIQKCLALAAGSNQGDAEAAIAQANRLMTEHNIAMVEVDTYTADDINYVNEEFISKNANAYHVEYVLMILKKFFFVRPIFSYNDMGTRVIEIVGTEENIAIADYTFRFLEREFKALWKEHKKQYNTSRRYMKTFYRGLYTGFSERLQEERDALIKTHGSTALVEVSSELDSAMNGFYESLGTKRMNGGNYNPAVAQEGRKQGRNIRVGSPVTSAGSAALSGN